MKTEKNELPIFSLEEFEKMVTSPSSKLESIKGSLSTGADKKEAAPGNFNYADIRGKLIGTALYFNNCYVTTWNRLLDPSGVPISARGLAYFFSGIQWCPGRGWPTYSARCPLNVSSPDMVYPYAKSHQLIVQFGGLGWTECSNSNVGIGNQITDVFVGVNDNYFVDNTGTFTFVISSIYR